MKMKIVVNGACAAGTKAASKAKRINPKSDVMFIDRRSFISHGECGIPYYVSDAVSDAKELRNTPFGVISDAHLFKKVAGVIVKTNAEVTQIEREAKVVRLFEASTSKKIALEYGRLTIATGSSPFIPKISNVDLPNILTVKSIEEAELLTNNAIQGNTVCIVGGGLIGLKTAEALQQKGMRVTVIEMQGQLLPGVLDREMAFIVKKQLRQQGVRVMVDCRVTGFIGKAAVEKVLIGDQELPVDLVVLAAGVNAAGGEASFSGVLGTSSLRIFNINAGKTGLTETEARAKGFDIEIALSPAHDKAHFFPGVKPIDLKLISERSTGRLLGLQAVGEGAVDKRIDAAATAITFHATAEQLCIASVGIGLLGGLI